MQLNKYIDHTLLKADATEVAIIALCNEAKKYNFKSVCINPHYVKIAYQALKDTDVLVCTVIGFPLGQTTTEVKAFESENAINNGAKEIDMVLNIGAMKSGEYVIVENDVKAVTNAAKGKAIVKVILETCLLTKEEIIKACEICKNAGADFVKTSTGFSTGGATAKDVALMKNVVGDGMEVKASGGVRTYDDAIKMIKAGATRIGTSNGVAILLGEQATESY